MRRLLVILASVGLAVLLNPLVAGGLLFVYSGAYTELAGEWGVVAILLLWWIPATIWVSVNIFQTIRKLSKHQWKLILTCLMLLPITLPSGLTASLVGAGTVKFYSFYFSFWPKSIIAFSGHERDSVVYEDEKVRVTSARRGALGLLFRTGIFLIELLFFRVCPTCPTRFSRFQGADDKPSSRDT
jgi:hypothetical protein